MAKKKSKAIISFKDFVFFVVYEREGGYGRHSKRQLIKSANSDLKIERSVLSSSSRVNAIATQNYGMVLSTDTESMDASAKGADASAKGAKATSDAAALQASAKDAQSSDVR